jgi:hypothetical protein
LEVGSLTHHDPAGGGWNRTDSQEIGSRTLILLYCMWVTLTSLPWELDKISCLVGHCWPTEQIEIRLTVDKVVILFLRVRLSP